MSGRGAQSLSPLSAVRPRPSRRLCSFAKATAITQPPLKVDFGVDKTLRRSRRVGGMRRAIWQTWFSFRHSSGENTPADPDWLLMTAHTPLLGSPSPT